MIPKGYALQLIYAKQADADHLLSVHFFVGTDWNLNNPKYGILSF
jgi:hypothetical protein